MDVGARHKVARRWGQCRGTPQGPEAMGIDVGARHKVPRHGIDLGARHGVPLRLHHGNAPRDGVPLRFARGECAEGWRAPTVALWRCAEGWRAPETSWSLDAAGSCPSHPPGMTIHKIKYSSKPGTPPGIRAMRNARRNQPAPIPKNSPSPPQTPATHRLRRDRRSARVMSHLVHRRTSTPGCGRIRRPA